MAHTFHGVWPALVTPFTPDDEINFPVLHDLVQYLLDKGVDGFTWVARPAKASS